MGLLAHMNVFSCALLHFISLSRIAFADYVHVMLSCVCDLQDTEAYGAGAIPNPPSALKHSDSAWSLQSMGSSSNSSYDGSECSDDSAQQSGGHVAQRRRRGRAVLVAGLAVGALAFSGACGGCSSSSLKAGRRHHARLSRPAVQQQKGQHVVLSHRLEEVPELLED